MHEFNIIAPKFLIALGAFSLVVALLLKLQIVKQGRVWGYSVRGLLLGGLGLLLWGAVWAPVSGYPSIWEALLQVCGMALSIVGFILGAKDKKRFMALQQPESTSGQK